MSSASEFDVFLSYRSRDRAAVEGLAGWLRAQGLAPYLDRWYLAAGVAWPQALESALGSCRAAAICVGPGEMGPWQQKETYLALERQTRDGLPVIPILLPGSEPPLGFLRQNTWIDLRHNVDDLIQLTILRKAILGEPPGPALRDEVGAQVAAICPYLGLRAFREEDSPLFFGREEFTATLFARVLSTSLVTVVGASGSGKSSLVQAGLLPQLRRERTPRTTWDILICRPGPQPFHRLAAALIAARDAEITEFDQFIQAEKLGSELAAGTVSLARALEFFLDKSRGTDRVLLVVDQFEELFTLTPPAERSRLVRAMLETVDAGRVTVVLTLRADFYSHAITLDRDLSGRLAAGIVNLGPMRRDELRRAIEKPADTVGLVFEAGLVDRILDHVEGEPGSLPLLEFALTELWARRRGARLEHEQYKALGQVDGAIGERATEVFRTLSPEAQRDARRLMARLVRVVAASEDGSDTRQRVSLTALDEGARTAMKPFADARLLVVGRDEASGEETVELAHEALIRSWPELREMLENDRRFLLWRQRLRLLLDEWVRSNRDEALLLRGAQLVEAKRLVRERVRDLNAGEHEFILSSERKARRPRRWAIAVASAASVAALAGVLWLAWTRSDTYQIREIRAAAPSLVARAERGVHPRTVHNVLRTLAAIGYEGDARAAAAVIRSLPDRVQTLSAIAYDLASTGQAPGAGRAAADAGAVARTITEAGDRARAYALVAWALAKAGAWKEAAAAAAEGRASADAVSDQADRAMALAMVAGARLAVGQLAEARNDVAAALVSARSIDDPENRSIALSVFAVIIAKVGAGEDAATVHAEAREAARRIEDSFRRIRALRVLDVARDGSGAEVALQGEDPGSVVGADAVGELPVTAPSRLSELRETITKGGTPDEIARIAAEADAEALTIGDPYERARFLARLGHTLFKAGRRSEGVTRLEEARTVSMGMIGAGARSVALAEIGMALADIGRPDAAGGALSEALTAARQVPEPDARSRALLELLFAFFAFPDAADHGQLVQQTVSELVKLGTLNSRERVAAAQALAHARRYREARAMVAGAEVGDRLRAYQFILADYGRRRDPELGGRLDRISREPYFPGQASIDDLDLFHEYLEPVLPRRERWR